MNEEALQVDGASWYTSCVDTPPLGEYYEIVYTLTVGDHDGYCLEVGKETREVTTRFTKYLPINAGKQWKFNWIPFTVDSGFCNNWHGSGYCNVPDTTLTIVSIQKYPEDY